MISYRKATLEDLERVWAYNMAMNPDEPRMQRWKESYIERNAENRAATYVVIVDGEPVGEVTLDYHAEAYGNPEIRKVLADGSKTGYLTALRIRKEFEGRGYVSGLMKFEDVGDVGDEGYNARAGNRDAVHGQKARVEYAGYEYIVKRRHKAAAKAYETTFCLIIFCAVNISH